MTTHARTLDPPTSHQAARRAEQSGLCETDAELFGRLVREQPGITIPEMAWSLCDAWNSIGQKYWQVRLNRRSGDVRRKGLAHSKDDGGNALRWYPGREESQGSLF